MPPDSLVYPGFCRRAVQSEHVPAAQGPWKSKEKADKLFNTAPVHSPDAKVSRGEGHEGDEAAKEEEGAGTRFIPTPTPTLTLTLINLFIRWRSRQKSEAMGGHQGRRTRVKWRQTCR